MTTSAKPSRSLLCLYHQTDEALWKELQLHLTVTAQYHPEYEWHHIPLHDYKQGVVDLRRVHLIILGISAHALCSLYQEHSDLYTALTQLSKSYRGEWDSRILAVRMRKTNWVRESERFLCYSVLPSHFPCIAGSPQRRNDACADVALSVELATKHRQDIDDREKVRNPEETRLTDELATILNPLGVQLEGERDSLRVPPQEGVIQHTALPLPEMINQVWFCEKCHSVGSFHRKKRADYYEGSDALRTSHTLQSPNCLWGTAYTHVINPTIVTSRASLVPDIPEWAREQVAQLMGW